MNDPIIVGGKTYRHFSELVPADGSPSPLRDAKENRQEFFKKRKKLPLDNTVGVYVPLDDRKVLFVIDKATVAPGSDEWRLIAATAECLRGCYPTLSLQARAALGMLRAVLFSRRPERSYADVEPDIFFYDVDEFRRKDGSLVAPAWTASCIVHDANHIWQHDNGHKWTGEDAESACWKLQVDNAGSLGLTAIDVAHLQSFIDNPAKILARANSKTFN